MGHRERLLAGARVCLYERGYTRTTARDIVAASDTNLASIGYHFGSKEALLTAALVQAFEEWGVEIDRVLRDGTQPDLLDRLESMWSGLVESFGTHRPLWVAGIEAFALAEHLPVLREQLADSYSRARPALAAFVIRDGGENVSDGTRRALGSFLLALMIGLTVQRLLDPEAAPSGKELARALQLIVGAINTPTGD
ncbi:TetR/AcrR family transcriptional regulator [Micromonospora rifamycinica]|uniref:Transcriptional regulator, TetR family n=1 Tax=Micromonospora rifamycinica TaxID=291594 RepID=A0A120F7Z4_9ACTN|nr:TetR/AcrR family transcriptional regulator [Micromonospora rifamycinica]KWV30979.1 TetR family transcriptional regulator [Micromonospora rifamycinica]SCG50827.1 transcriptional regulator, TetR family [Micromonospora rifamycinica]